MQTPRSQFRNPPPQALPLAPKLAYRAPSAERPGPKFIDIVAGTFRLCVVGVCAPCGLFSLFEALQSMPKPDDDFWRFALLGALLLLLAATSFRSAWFYLGGWNHTPNGMRQMQEEMLPWRWRSR